MVKNIAFRIKVKLIETEVEPSAELCPEEQPDGAFQLVLPEGGELHLSALDQAASTTTCMRSVSPPATSCMT
jgi:hypothetical protein